jgi:ComF family protein
MRSTLRSLIDLVLAPVCLGCEARIDPRDAARLVCRPCRARLRAVPSPACARCGATRRSTGRPAQDTCAECESWPEQLVFARAACLLIPPADTLVHQLKYRGWPALAEPLAERMAALRLPVAAHEANVCVPVPTSAQRIRERGYNQAERLAAAFARRTGRELVPALVRGAGSASQTGLQPVGRRANVAGAFRADSGICRSLVNTHVILIDDVLTTGATAGECVRTLVGAGIRCVTLMTFARALDARRLTSNGWSYDK